jgi:hypothetical protein
MSHHANHEVKLKSEDGTAVDPNADKESESMQAVGGLSSQREGASGEHDETAKGKPKGKTKGNKKSKKKGKKKSKMFATAAAVFALVLAIENIWIATGGLLEPHRIRDVRASLFLSTHYFPTAVQDPVSAMNEWGTSDFRELHVARGLESYRNWYSPVQEIPAKLVRVEKTVDSSPDTFKVSIERVLKSGTHDKRTIVMRLKCSSVIEAYTPGLSCSPDNLRVDYSAEIVEA